MIEASKRTQGNEMLMVLAMVNTRIAHMMGESFIPVEAFVIPSMMNGAAPVVCHSIEDGAPFSMVEYR